MQRNKKTLFSEAAVPQLIFTQFDYNQYNASALTIKAGASHLKQNAAFDSLSQVIYKNLIKNKPYMAVKNNSYLKDLADSNKLYLNGRSYSDYNSDLRGALREEIYDEVASIPEPPFNRKDLDVLIRRSELRSYENSLFTVVAELDFLESFLKQKRKAECSSSLERPEGGFKRPRLKE